jgi:hypothetical protein
MSGTAGGSASTFSPADADSLNYRHSASGERDRQDQLPDDEGRSKAFGLAPNGVSTRGLASLEIDIPQRGEAYRFVTARGELEITTQYVDTTWLTRMAWLAGTLVGIVALFFAARSIDWTFFDRRLRWAGPALLLAAGLLLMLATSYGPWGLVLAVVGGLLLMRAWLVRNSQ